jgi:hypothetical protein
MYRFLWNPLKWIGHKLDFLTVNRVLFFFIPAYLLGLFLVYNQEYLSAEIEMKVLPFLFSFIGLIMVLKSFAERKNVFLSWILIIMSHFWVALAVSFNEHFKFDQIHIYLSGVALAGALGYVLLKYLGARETSINLDQFHGFSYRYPKLAFVFLMICLGVTGFPITPTFIGEDLIFSHIHEDQFVLAFFTSVIFIIDGLSVIRIFARVFMGPHVKSIYEMAYRSS